MSVSVLRTPLLAMILAAMGVVTSVVGCSSGPAAPPGSADGGVGDGPDGGDGGSGSCNATAPITLGTVDIDALDMIGAGDFVVFRDNKVGLDTAIPGRKTGGLVSLPKAGGSAELALAPTAADRAIGGFRAEGNTIYAVDYKPGTPADTQIVKKTLPGLPGSAVESLGITGLWDGMLLEIIGVDATNLYFRGYSNSGGAGSPAFALYRAPKSGGAAELVTRLPGTNADVRFPVLIGDKLWFAGGAAGERPTFYTAPANGTDVAPTKIDPPNKCVGNILIGVAGVACMAFSDVYGYDPTFANEKLLSNAQKENAKSLLTPRFIDGTRVILTEDSANPEVPLRAVPFGGGPVTKIACDRATILGIFADETHFYWHEERTVGAVRSRNVYKMPK